MRLEGEMAGFRRLSVFLTQAVKNESVDEAVCSIFSAHRKNEKEDATVGVAGAHLTIV
jgi:hypothetical protein